jgi:superfamily II DNA or RNA helicase
MGTTFSPGSLVRARGRDWFVLDGSTDALLLLRSLGVGDDIGILQGEGALEPVEQAHFPPPDPARHLGQPASVLLLRDAFRLARRAPAGPLRSLTSAELVPHPYQLVPLLMALRQTTTRLLIADDVGTGKTIEAAIIARELIERGVIKNFSVLCPPQLAQQWADALTDLFHLPTEMVLSGTAARLERQCEPGQSLFERFPYTAISTDYIKQPTRRAAFLANAPQLIIVDEAHTCADSGAGSAAQQRHALLKDLAADPTRHILLLTATPHNGDTAAFNSLLSLLSPQHATLPERWTARESKRVAPYLIQRRRAELTSFLDASTTFPTRIASEHEYTLATAYRKVFDEVLDLCRDLVRADQARPGAARMRWWSALALLRSISSSPAAGIATLSNRALIEVEDTDAINARGARAVLDRDEDNAEAIDLPPSLSAALAADWSGIADKLKGLSGKSRDTKLKAALDIARTCIAEGRCPIFFCRFLDTATYLGEQLRRELGDAAHVEIITGQLPPEERQERIAKLADKPARVLVTTDCLSEGINLQHLFDAVIHYDMAWNPTRHEQREGRVDRFGQPSPTVQTITLVGKDNPIDGIIFEVLIRKHLSIRGVLGVAIPVPSDRHVEEAILEGLLLRDKRVNTEQLALDFMADLPAIVKDLHTAWDKSAAAHKHRAHFTHDDLHEQLRASLPPLLRHLSDALGDRADVAQLLDLCDLLGYPHAIPRDPLPSRVNARVTALARALLDGALDDGPQTSSPAQRAGCAYDASVTTPTALYLVRMRLTALAQGGGANRYAEELVTLALPLDGQQAVIHDGPTLDALLAAAPARGPAEDEASMWITRALGAWSARMGAIKKAAYRHADSLTALHNTMRDVEGISREALFDIFEPLDLLGVLVFLPEGGAR